MSLPARLWHYLSHTTMSYPEARRESSAASSRIFRATHQGRPAPRGMRLMSRPSIPRYRRVFVGCSSAAYSFAVKPLPTYPRALAYVSHALSSVAQVPQQLVVHDRLADNAQLVPGSL